MSQQELLQRIANMQAELASMVQALANLEAGYVSGDERRNDFVIPMQKKVRWRYVPGTWYRINGKNPFRNGNNYNLFQFLAARFGERPFSREQLGQAIEQLKDAGRLDSVQSEEQIVLVFLRTAGAEKGRIEMSHAPHGGDEVGPIADIEDALPPEAGDDEYQLLGEMPFRTGVNVEIWSRLGNDPFPRSKLLAIVQDLVSNKAFESVRPPETIVRDFLGRVQEKGRLRRGRG